jgi:hypothetical protein
MNIQRISSQPSQNLGKVFDLTLPLEKVAEGCEATRLEDRLWNMSF